MILDKLRIKEWSSNHKKVFIISTIVSFLVMIISALIHDGRNVTLYMAAIMLTVLYIKMFSGKIITEIRLSDKVLSVVYFDKFKKGSEDLSLENLKYSLVEDQISHVSKALKLKFFDQKEKLKFYATEEYFLWSSLDLRIIEEALNETYPPSPMTSRNEVT